MRIWWPLLLLALFSDIGECQRLSQGASDWYMRFRGISMAKRHFDDPIIYSYEVRSVVRHRYSVNSVTSVVRNPANVHRVYRFGLVMPKTAFVSNVTLERGDEVLRSVPESSWSKLEDEDNSNGSNGHSHYPESSSHNGRKRFKLLRKQQDKFNSDFTDFQQLILPINLRPNENVTITLVYEDLLKRKFDKYTHSLTVNPGSIVEDFKIELLIEENRPLVNVSVTAPVIGDLTSYSDETSISPNMSRITFNMTKVQQFDYFGNHGVTGEFKAEFDIEPVQEDNADVVVENDFFVHFYDHTKSDLKSIPKHVIVLLDVSESMSGPKLMHARKSIDILLRDLNEDDYVNVLLFNSSIYEWGHGEGRNNGSNELSNETFRCDKETRESIADFLNSSVVPSGKSDLASAVEHGMELDKRLWISQALPENAHTMIVMITDGRSPVNRSEARDVRRRIRRKNQLSQIPILILGMGFDANMDFLENIAEKSKGFAENVIEDLEVEPQLLRIRTYLNDVVLKNLVLNYVDPAVFDRETLTRSKFKYFHKGGGVAVAGRIFRDETSVPEFEVEITGQSAKGLYMEHPDTLELFGKGCDGNATLCSEKNLQGRCVTITNSRANLIQYSFGNKPSSMKVLGDCGWILYDEAYYSGDNATFFKGVYEMEEVNIKVSSLKRMPSTFVFENKEVSKGSVPRLWAFMTIKNVLWKLSERPERLEPETVDFAASLASKYQFLTPFTDLRLVSNEALRKDPIEPDAETFINNDLLTYKELSPVLSSLKDPVIARQWQSLESCQPPVKCIGHFHIEEFQQSLSCAGSLSLYTKPGFEGDTLEIRSSVFQIYHYISSQRFRSVSSEGKCCWLLFDKRFFAGNVEKICGDSEISLRSKNTGSIKLIGPSTPTSIIK